MAANKAATDYDTKKDTDDTPASQSFYCDTCGIPCFNQNSYNAHVNGKKHKKQQRKLPSSSQCEDRSHSNPLLVEPGPHNHGAQNNILESPTRPKISSRFTTLNNQTKSMEDAAPAKEPDNGKVKTENIGKGNLGANNGEHCYVCNITTRTKKDAIIHRQSQAHCKSVSIARRGAMALLRMLQIPLYDNFAPPFATAAYE